MFSQKAHRPEVHREDTRKWLCLTQTTHFHSPLFCLFPFILSAWLLLSFCRQSNVPNHLKDVCRKNKMLKHNWLKLHHCKPQFQVYCDREIVWSLFICALFRFYCPASFHWLGITFRFYQFLFGKRWVICDKKHFWQLKINKPFKHENSFNFIYFFFDRLWFGTFFSDYVTFFYVHKKLKKIFLKIMVNDV